ncbi:sensor histidine kinase [Arcticibacter tournemirensis]
MIQNEKNPWITIVVQVMLWLLFGLLLLLYLPSTWGVRLPAEFWIKQTEIFVLLTTAYYLNSIIIVPRVLLKNHILGFILLVILLSAGITLIVQLSERALLLPELMDKTLRKPGSNRPVHPPFDIFILMVSFLILGISTSVTAIQKSQQEARKRQLLEQEKVSSELSYLRAQINPHFFFNTLNNIYALTHIDVESSRQALHKLSRMMRYLLYETQSQSALLSKEISFIVDYIELMKLRLTDKVTVQFNAPSLANDPQIAPMLLLPFVENAFKHGVSALQPGYINIDINVNARILKLDIRNTVYSERSVVLEEESSGIGMNNTRRRLDLLYPGKYTLEAAEKSAAREFRVNLTLDLS